MVNSALDDLKDFVKQAKTATNEFLTHSALDTVLQAIEIVRETYTKDVPKQIIHYVLGFAFSRDGSHVVLIQKDRPEWQKGKYNGIGGKIEHNEVPSHAMWREFSEETGVNIPPDHWIPFLTTTFMNDPLGGVAVIHCFKTFTDEIHLCKTQETEKVEIHHVDNVQCLARTRKLDYEVLMALDGAIKNATITYR
jgi:8-oxo-dGTP diphosphatase